MPYLQSLSITLLIEVPIYAAALTVLVGTRPLSSVGAGVAVNLASHPLGFLVLAPALSRAAGPLFALAAVEVAAWILEATLLLIWVRRDPLILFGISFVANGLSFSAGLLLR